ncbi:MAG: radical SAM protein [Planctomycetaceae bacterium]|nr:radical SAM protein [Planctomycetaceae bacterium]
MSAVPVAPLASLDELWFQVSGTLCNLKCEHCFISCSPTNDSFGYLSLDRVMQLLEESIAQGVKEYYFTGGEPFLNRDLVPMVEQVLQVGAVTVLTNGTVLKTDWLKRLRAVDQSSRYSLEFRVSIDGPTPEMNDPIRGERSFERAMQGVSLMCEYNFLPIITMTRTWDEADDEQILGQFREVLKQHGYARPRLKVLPRLKIGAEAQRTAGYNQFERITPQMMEGFDVSQLLCNHSRVATDKGIYVCPILIDSPAARLGETLQESQVDFPLVDGACYTCYQYGSICANPSSKKMEA